MVGMHILAVHYSMVLEVQTTIQHLYYLHSVLPCLIHVQVASVLKTAMHFINAYTKFEQ